MTQTRLASVFRLLCVWLLISWPGLGLAACEVGDGPVQEENSSCIRWATSADAPAAESDWAPLPADGLQLGYTSDPVWLQLPLKNVSDTGRDLFLVLGTAQTDRIEAWWSGSVNGKLLGDQVALEDRASTFLHPTLPVRLGAQEMRTVTVRIQSDSLMSIEPQIYDAVSLLEQVRDENRIAFWMQGCMTTIFGVFGILALAGRNAAFGWYAVHVFLGLSYHYAITGVVARLVVLTGTPGRVMVLNLAGATIAAAVLYARELLKNDVSSRRDRVLQGVFVVLGSTVLLQWVLPPQVGAPLVSLAISISILAITVAGIHAAVRKETWGLATAVCWAPLAISGVFAAVSSIGGPVSLQTSLRMARLSYLWQFMAMAGMLAFNYTTQRSRERGANQLALREAQQRAQTEQALKKSERQLERSQRNEAIGRLAGGVAHDFNNLLTVVVGNAEEARLVSHEPEVTELLDEVLNASARATDLVRQLLAYSRRQPMQQVPTDIHLLLEETGAMLTRLIGERIQLQMVLNAPRPVVEADRSQLESVIVNLVVNARDAMSDGGELLIRTYEMAAQAATQVSESFQPKVPVLVIEVVDTGSGMTEQVQAQVFEPFFTTKDPLDGTGLGLATVMGVVQQHGGWIGVESKPGEGTTFTILLPTTVATPVLSENPAPSRRRRKQLRTLLAEDEDAVRRVLKRGLTSLGLDVTVARDGTEAMALLDARPFDVLVTDMVMPGAVGTEVAAHGHRLYPSLVTVIVSGYAEAISSGSTKLGKQVRLVPKPCRLEDISAALDALLVEAEVSK